MTHSFKPGDRVEVIAGPRAGEITTVTTDARAPHCRKGDAHRLGICLCEFAMIHRLAIPTDSPGIVTYVGAPPHWLRPYPLRETEGPLTAEQLRKLCGVKEMEDA